MTREEEINKFINNYLTNLHGLKHGKDREYLNDTNEASLVKEGVAWADKHPKSPWISVEDDLPCNHSDLVLTYNDIPFSTKRVLVMTDSHTLFLCEMKKDDDHGWIWNYLTKDKINHWFPIPELPKE